jgi:cell division protein FtsW
MNMQQNFSYPFLFCTGALLTIGLVFTYSASCIFALEVYGSAHYFFIKQLLGTLAGLLGMVLIRALPPDILSRFTPLFFLVSLAATAGTLVPGIGRSIHGSRRWLALGPISFQPSELLKIAFILYVAWLLAKKKPSQNHLFSTYVPLLAIMGITAVLLMQQPDFGQMVTLSTTAFLLCFVAQINIYYLIGTFIPVVPLIALLIYLKPYRLQRVLTFLNPWADPRGSGFQIIQSLIAIGSGGCGGVGVSHSKQKFFYLPMQHTDFIFSIIAEETGFIGSCIIISLYLFFLYYGIKIGLSLRSRFTSLYTLGFTFLITLQALINLAVATGLLPTKGIGLPFISYGNSSLIAHLIMIGLILNGLKNNRFLQQKPTFL